MYLYVFLFFKIRIAIMWKFLSLGVFMARRTIFEQISILETERDRLETKLAEQEGYEVLIAQGNRGAETHFTDISKIHTRLAAIYNQLETLYAHKGL